jgi:hypothetical protein
MKERGTGGVAVRLQIYSEVVLWVYRLKRSKRVRWNNRQCGGAATIQEVVLHEAVCSCPYNFIGDLYSI